LEGKLKVGDKVLEKEALFGDTYLINSSS